MKRKILFIFAHPDDEAFGPAATIAKYAHQGVSIFLTTLTRGEAGTLGPAKELSPQRLAQLRSKELQCSAKVLGVAKLHQLDLPDGHLSEYPQEQALKLIQTEIQSIQPDMVITFHPNGISGHPDHRQVTKWVYQVISQMTSPPVLLYYGIAPAQKEKIKFRELHALRTEEITHKIPVKDFLPFKLKAIECHASQKELWEKLKDTEGGYQSFAAVDHFSQVIPTLYVQKPFNDLFQNN